MGLQKESLKKGGKSIYTALKKSNRRLYRAMRKHGIENFKFEVVAYLKELDNSPLLFQIEKEYITKK